MAAARFADLKGQEHVVQALSNALTQGRLHHAYLFTGTRGVGKTTLARIIAKCLNCETGVTATPCGVCSACTQIDAGRFVDLLELDAASNTGVDNMREVLDNAQYAPTVGRYKVYIIDEVHMLSKPAFNSMLKTLEEPPAHVKFILATTDPQKIPVTVLSRCLQFNLKPMPVAIGGVASGRGAGEGKRRRPNRPRCTQLARAANGSMRDALSLADQAIAYGGGKSKRPRSRPCSARSTANTCSPCSTRWRRTMAMRCWRRRARSPSAASPSTPRCRISATCSPSWRCYCTHRTAVESGMDAERMQAAAAQLDAETVQLYYQIALNGRRDLPYAPDEFSGFCMTLLRMLAFAPGAAVSDRPVPVRAVPATRAEPTPRAAAPAPVVATRAVAVPDELTTAPEPSPPSVATLVASEPSPQGAWDWLAVVAELRLGGMAKMLADHCELVSQAGDAVTLRVGEAHKHLLDRTYQDKLVGALRDKHGATLQVTFEIGKAAEQTPQQVRTRIKEARQAEAVAAIESDPFVRELVDQFGGQIDAATIQPLGEST